MAIKTTVEEKAAYAILHVHEDVNESTILDFLPVFVDVLTKYATGPGKGMIIDFGGKANIDHVFLKEIAPMTKVVKENQSTIAVINCTPAAVKLIKESGMDGALKIALTLEKALRQMGIELPKTPVKIDVAFVNPFIEGTLETLSVQCSTEAMPEKIYLKGQGPTIDISIAAILGLTSVPFNGSIALCFPEKTFLAIMGKMLGENYTTITKDLEDGVGELLNIIFGFAKAKLNERNYAVAKAIPTVISGKDLAVRHMTHDPTVVLPFKTEHGPFHIEIGTEPNTLE